MSENYNNQFEAWRKGEDNNIGTEDVFAGINDETDDDGKQEEPPQKVSFAELRQGRKIPRLKKTMVLTIISGGIFLFLFLVNIVIRKDVEEKKYFDEKKDAVAVGNEFSLGDLGKRTVSSDSELVYFNPPPAYTPVPAYTAAPAVKTPSPAYYSDSDLLAMKAQIGKEGGYGPVFNTAVYNQQEPQAHFPSREEYTARRVDDIVKLAQMSGQGDTVNIDRANTGRYSEAGKYNPDNTQAGTGLQYLNSNTLFPGTIIHAVLVSRIDTDYPGPIHARVVENVYDSMTGQNLLIPQGTILQGNYSSSSIGVAKVQIAWEAMVVSYGGVAYQVSLGGMAGVDKRGRSGIAGTLDDHYFEWLKAAGIVSLFTMLNSEIAYQTKGQNNQQIKELMDINQGLANRMGNRLIERALNIQPTVRVANGTALSVSVNTAVQLRPFPAIKAEEKWVRK